MATASEIQSMFGRVAVRYDFLNHVLSGGVDFWWRRVLASHVKRRKPGRLLDLATGSGDVLLSLLAAGAASTYFGADFCLPMLQVAKRKGLNKLTVGDGLLLPFADSSFDAVTIAFGLRNWVDRPAGLREMARVLSPGGYVYILEFSQPWRWIRPFYYFYLRNFLPRLARLCGAEAGDYVYLCNSIQAFPTPDALGKMMEEAGFSGVGWSSLTAGLVALHWGRK